MSAVVFLLIVIVWSAWSASRAFICTGKATRQHRTLIEEAAKAHRTDIQHATMVHPTSLTARDHCGRWWTVKDNDDRAPRQKRGASASGACKEFCHYDPIRAPL